MDQMRWIFYQKMAESFPMALIYIYCSPKLLIVQVTFSLDTSAREEVIMTNCNLASGKEAWLRVKEQVRVVT